MHIQKTVFLIPKDVSALRRTWALVILTLVFTQDVLAENPLSNWPQWRGPTGTGATIDANPPTTWTESENVRWRTAIPGRGHSTPIVWDNTVFVTTAIPVGEKFDPRPSGRPGAHDNLPVDSKHEFVVIAIARKTGQIKWQRKVAAAIPKEGAHYTASLASASPVTDGQHLYAFFGSHGLYCLDLNGKLVWEKQIGIMHTKHGHGEGCSPVLSGDNLLINWDHEEQSFVMVLDKHSGKEVWSRERNEVTSWSTPIVVEHEGRWQAIVCGTSRVRGYDLETGAEIWQCGGLSANVVATPIYNDGVVYVGSSYEKRALMAIDLRDASGDLTGSDHVLWSRSRGTPYVPSPLLYEGGLYFLTHYQNVITRLESKTGVDAPGAFRLGGLRNIYASPVAADGHVFVTDTDGNTLVFTAGPIPRIVGVNRLGESVNASLALVDREIFVRGEKHLFCIAED